MIEKVSGDLELAVRIMLPGILSVINWLIHLIVLKINELTSHAASLLI